MAIRYLSGINVDSNTLFVDDANNRVGIGTASPSTTLDVLGKIKLGLDGTYGGSDYVTIGFGGTSNGYNRVFGYNGTSDGLFLASATGQGIAFRTNGGSTDNMRITAAGNVGIGTTSPNRNLTVSGNGTLLGIQSDTVGGYSEIEMTANGVSAGYIFKNSAAFTSYAGAGSLNIYNSGSIGFHTASVTNAMFIASATGNVGIGTTAPTSPLHISSATNKTITLDYTGGSGSYSWASFRQSGTEQFRIWGSYSDGYLSFYNDQVPAHQLTLASSGNVGIGTTSPVTTLQVNATSPAIRLQETGSGGDKRLELSVNSSGVATIAANQSAQVLTFETVGSERMRIASTGATRLNAYGSGSFTGTVAYNLAVDSSGNIIETAGGVVDGSGTANYVSKWSDANTLTDSVIYDNGTNVGIGTTSPTIQAGFKQLSISAGVSGDVRGALNIQGARTADSTFASLAFYHKTNYVAGIESSRGGADNSGSLEFYTSNAGTLAERIRVTPAGNVGIGTTSPLAILDVYQAGQPQLRVRGTTGANHLYQDSTTGTTINDGLFVGIGGDQTGYIYHYEANPLVFATSNAERMRITAGGNVGIGTTSPGGRLEVSGGSGSTGVQSYFSTGAGYTDPAAGNAAFPGGAKIILWNDTSTPQKASIGMDGSADIWFNNAGGQAGAGFTFYTGDGASATPSARLKITKSGDVGIGNTTPSQKLHVTGNIRVTGAYYDSSNSAGSSGQVLSSTGSGTAWVNQGEATATSLYDLLPAARVAFNWTGQVVNDTWTTVFSKSSNLLTTGTWMVRMYVSDFATGGGHYTYTYSGMFTWYQDTTNQGGESAASEIYLHRMGHAANASVLYLRTTETAAASSGDGLFQIKGNYSNTSNQTISFQFVKIF